MGGRRRQRDPGRTPQQIEPGGLVIPRRGDGGPILPHRGRLDITDQLSQRPPAPVHQGGGHGHGTVHRPHGLGTGVVAAPPSHGGEDLTQVDRRHRHQPRGALGAADGAPAPTGFGVPDGHQPAAGLIDFGARREQPGLGGIDDGGQLAGLDVDDRAPVVGVAAVGDGRRGPERGADVARVTHGHHPPAHRPSPR